MNLTAPQKLQMSASEAVTAHASRKVLSRYAQSNAPLMLRVADGDHADLIELSATAVALLMEILDAIAAEQEVTVTLENAELTTTQAAGVLNVSRPFLIKLLDEQKIPHRKVGKHYRIRVDDMMLYKASVTAKQEYALDQLVAETQKHGLGYEKP